LIETHKPAERAFLVGICLQKDKTEDIKESIQELAELVDTAGASVIKTFIQNRKGIEPAFYIGKGKAEEIKIYAEEENIDTVIFDTELSPMQIRNLEKIIGKKILDRSWVILDIFANRAKTREAKTQVELAQLKYFMPRLTRQWTHLSRQVGGGVGTKGPGETQLEVDKRLIKDRINFLERELEKITDQRIFRKRGREEKFKVVLAGYTNVGKSTLMNRISNAGVFVENRLFATLDSTTRVITLPGKKEFLLSDTVGFIKKLPHNLVASFKSTLEEVVEADLILQVVDISHSNYEEQIKTVEKVLDELGAGGKKMLYVFNKSDSISAEELDFRVTMRNYGEYITISAKDGKNIDKLIEKINEIMEHSFVYKEIYLPLSETKLLAKIHSLTEILNEEYEENKVRVSFKASKENASYLENLVKDKQIIS